MIFFFNFKNVLCILLYNLVSDRHNPLEKRSVPHLSRSDLEDQFYKFKEENFQLKKATKNQEENLKK